MGTAPQPGQQIANYRLLEKLGQGGMGVVYLAEDLRLGRKVAIKFLPADAAHDPLRRQRFEQEARAAAALNHPAIAAVYELEEAAGEVYIVFEYVRGQTLRGLVARGGLGCDDVLDIATDITEALVAAHAAGIVHRDLKPENVMRTPEGGCKVLDFGIAKLSPSAEPAVDTPTAMYDGALTTGNVIVGTVGYMSPEQLEAKPVDFRSDLFSFGAVLYELATGVPPFHSGSAASTIAAILNFEPVPLAERNPVHPPELERIVRKCLRKNRDDRYQSTRDLLVDLRSLKHESTATQAVATTRAATPVAEDEDSLFHAVSRHLLTPRRWWEMHQLFATLVYAPIAFYLALKSSVITSTAVNTAVAGNWHGWQGVIQALQSGDDATIWKNIGLPFFVLLMLALSATAMGRLYLICLAMFVPARLRTEVGRVQRLLRAGYVVASLQFIVAGWLLLRVTDQELIFGVGIVAFGVLSLLAITAIEPVMVRSAFPQAFAAKPPPASETGRRGWFWAHYLLTLFATTPVVVWLTWSARPYMPEALRLPLFLATNLAIGLHWSARFAVVSTAFGDPQALAAQMQRMRPWIRWSGWPIVAGLGAIALAIANVHDGLAAIFGGLAMGGVACLLFLDPAVERAAFPTAAEPAGHSVIALLRQWFRHRRTGDSAAQAQRQRFREIAGMQLIMATLVGSLLVSNVVTHPTRFWARAMENWAHAEPSGQIAWLLGYSFALVFLISVLVASVGFAVRAARGEIESVRAFHRFFWLYCALDQLWVPGILFAVGRTPALAVALPLVPVVALMPFYQRRRAREILAATPEGVAVGTGQSA